MAPPFRWALTGRLFVRVRTTLRKISRTHRIDIAKAACKTYHIYTEASQFWPAFLLPCVVLPAHTLATWVLLHKWDQYEHQHVGAVCSGN
jgi:hypothetical protein